MYMKSVKQYIFEKLKVTQTTYTLFPKTRDELIQMIKDEISKNGNRCSLNHINYVRNIPIRYIPIKFRTVEHKLHILYI